MKGRLILGMGLVVLVVAGVVMLPGFGPAEATDSMAPDEVVSDFYDWYLGFIGQGEVRQNPLVERAYRSSEHLSAAFIAEVDDLLDTSERGGGDPFLLAQDVPVKIEVGELTLSGDGATVKVEMFWGGNPVPSERLAVLRLMDGQWKIEGVELVE